MKLSKTQVFSLWYLYHREQDFLGKEDQYDPKDLTAACSMMAGPGTGTRVSTVTKLESLGLLESFEGTNDRILHRYAGGTRLYARRVTEKVTRWRLTVEGRTLGKTLEHPYT